MKLVDEKKALQEISNLKRSRRTLEASGSVDDAISVDKARIDDLKKLLDDPEAKKVSDRFDELKKEMDGLRDEGNKAYEEKNKLYDQRTELSAQLVRTCLYPIALLMIRMPCTAESVTLPKATDRLAMSEFETYEALLISGTTPRSRPTDKLDKTDTRLKRPRRMHPVVKRILSE
jgi:hypothetical protein